jgi:transposase-like protein
MTLMKRLERERNRAIRAALKQHRTIRAAAKALGMPKSTLFDYLKHRSRKNGAGR